MPSNTQTPPSAAPEIEEFNDGRRLRRVLVAEDIVTNQQVALAILEKLGCSADAVANGKEALAALRSIPYDLVLMDCQMPEMNGYEAAARIRNPQSGVRNPQVPIVAVTAHAMKGDREKCLAAGIDDYLTKPVDPAMLAVVLDKWLPQTEGSASSAAVQSTSRRSTSPSVSTAAFDENALLERLMGDRELARTLVAGFLKCVFRRWRSPFRVMPITVGAKRRWAVLIVQK